MLQKKKFSFPYSQKIHSQRDFNKVFKKGLRLESAIIKILAYQNPQAKRPRMALITSRKVGKATDRNRTKRRLREIFRTNKNFLAQGLDLLFILKPKTATANYVDLEKSILELLKKAGLYKI
jgi:ribonuclease P protein component